jgi:hypothetical protein
MSSPPLRSALAPLLLALAGACSPGPCPKGSTRAADGLCYLPDDGGADSGSDVDPDTGDSDTAIDVTDGDPISVVGYEGENEPGGRLLEWTDSAILDESVGAVCGVVGVGLVDLTDGSTMSSRPTPPCLRMAADDGVVVASDRRSQLTILDVSSPPDILEMGFIRFDPDDTRHEDIAIHDGRVIVGWHGNGARLYDPGANLLGTLPATDAFAVGLHGNRAVISDAEELVLWDVTDPRFAIELSRVALPGEGRDIEFDGSRVAVAMGGAGVGVWDVQDDTLVARGSMIVPGAGLAVALDDDEVWVGSWQHTVLLRLTDDGLVTMGHEAPRFSAMGVSASGGTALVADWHGHMTLQRERDVASPELIVNEDLYFGAGDATQNVRVENHGPLPLEWAFGEVPDGFSVSEAAVTVAPGGVEVITVEGPETLDYRAALPWSSNDPDESSGEIALAPPDRGVGAAHPDFSLQGFTWPDRDTSEYTLSAYEGKVVVLAYFALF